MYLDLMDGRKILALILLVCLCAWLFVNYMNKTQADREEQLLKLLEAIRNSLHDGASGCSNAIEKLGDQISDLFKVRASHILMGERRAKARVATLDQLRTWSDVSPHQGLGRSLGKILIC